MPTVIGTIEAPAASGPKPSSRWRYCTVRKNTDIWPPTTSEITIRPPTRCRLRSREARSIGCATRRSVRAKATSSAAPRTKPPRVCERDPAVLGHADQRPDQRHRGAGRGGRADEVEPAGTARGLGHEAPRQGEHEDADRHVDQQGPAPRAEVGDHAAEQQADGAAAHADGGEQGERPVARRLVGGAGGEQGEYAGGGQRGADALGRAGRDQLAGRLGEPTQERGHGEQREADLEDAEPAEHVAEPAAGEQQTAEGQRVAVEDPGQGRRSEAEGGVHRRAGPRSRR